MPPEGQFEMNTLHYETKMDLRTINQTLTYIYLVISAAVSGWAIQIFKYSCTIG